jgi:hypothetical protein
LAWLGPCGFLFALIAAAWSGCGGKSSSGSTGTAGTSGDAGTGGSIGGAAGGGGIAGGRAGTGGSIGGAAGGSAGSGGGAGGAAGGAGGTGGAPCAQNGAVCDFPDTTCYYEMHAAGMQNSYFGCTCGRGDGGLSRVTCCFVGNAFSPNGILTPANTPDWWLTPSGSPWRCPPGS